MDNCLYTGFEELLEVLDEEKKEKYASQFMPFDYYMLMSKVPTDKKGNVNRGAYSSQRSKARKIKEAFVLTQKQLLERMEEEKKLEELNDKFFNKWLQKKKGVA